jgi:hypothetical protein
MGSWISIQCLSRKTPNSLRQAGSGKVPITALNTRGQVNITFSVPYSDLNYVVDLTLVGGGLDGILGFDKVSPSVFRVYGQRSIAIADLDFVWSAQKRTQ